MQNVALFSSESNLCNSGRLFIYLAKIETKLTVLSARVVAEASSLRGHVLD